MKFYYFHLMPYYMEHDAPSSWVTLSNRHYDPAVGHTLYNQYLDQLEYAERLGWDGLCVNEHHQNCYGTMPSPNVMAEIAILGNGAAPAREPAAHRRGDRDARRGLGRPCHRRIRPRHQCRVFLDRR